MTKQNSTVAAHNGQPAPNDMNTPAPERPAPLPRLSDHQALSIARLACASILYGDPPACTFDLLDLELAMARLGVLQIILDRDTPTIPPSAIPPSGPCPEPVEGGLGGLSDEGSGL